MEIDTMVADVAEGVFRVVNNVRERCIFCGDRLSLGELEASLEDQTSAICDRCHDKYWGIEEV